MGALNRASVEARSLVAMFRSGALTLESPRRTLRAIRALNQYGPFGAASQIATIHHGDEPAINDEAGEITYAELDELTNRLANAFTDRGLEAGSKIGILCRNHRFPLMAAFAASRAGISAVWLNTAFSARQMKEVAEREGVELLVHDAEFNEDVGGIDLRFGRMVCLSEEADPDDIELAMAASGATMPPVPDKPGRIVLLTSGTTGTPKGAPRPEPRSLSIAGAVMERMPMKRREATVIGPPIFHGVGLLIALLSISLGSKLVLRRGFTPEQMLDDIETHHATTVCVVPVMLQRILALGDEEIGSHDLSSVRAIFCAGSALPGDVAIRAMDELGDVVYNLYGSTEVSVATFATPADIRRSPTTVGKTALGSRVRILDAAGDPSPPGETGRVFVGAISPFEGYTGGGGKEIIDGLLSSGDLGHFDEEGFLFIDGRDDEMIVSGGENVFPHEVEEILITHPAIDDAAVIGVDDEEFGQRLRAFVVCPEDDAPTESDVQEFVKSNLARYKSPRDVIFMDELPRNPTGKILKRKLPAD